MVVIIAAIIIVVLFLFDLSHFFINVFSLYVRQQKSRNSSHQNHPRDASR